MSAMTPIKVRGKRGGARDEKWNAGKRRKRVRDGSPASSIISSAAVSISSRATSSTPRKRKRRIVELSRLEELPSEIIQLIFEYSANPDFSLASPRLAAQLSSHHVYHQITSRILEPVFDYAGSKAPDGALLAATRLLNSRFMTWTFFRDWFGQELKRRKFVLGIDYPQNLGDGELQRYCLNTLIKPSPGLLPPVKLLHGPWSEERVHFLQLFASRAGNITELSPALGELARVGLEQAVSEGSLSAVTALLRMGLQPDTELVRIAVIDEGCKRRIVLPLLTALRSPEQKCSSTLDYFDPMLWSWADRARANGNPDGKWLTHLLKSFARVQGIPPANVKAESPPGE